MAKCAAVVVCARMANVYAPKAKRGRRASFRIAVLILRAARVPVRDARGARLLVSARCHPVLMLTRVR